MMDADSDKAMNMLLHMDDDSAGEKARRSTSRGSPHGRGGRGSGGRGGGGGMGRSSSKGRGRGSAGRGRGGGGWGKVAASVKKGGPKGTDFGTVAVEAMLQNKARPCPRIAARCAESMAWKKRGVCGRAHADPGLDRYSQSRSPAPEQECGRRWLCHAPPQMCSACRQLFCSH